MAEPGEVTKTEAPTLDLSKAKEGRLLPPKIKVDGKLVGTNLWPKMLTATNQTQKEHGLTVSLLGKRILTSGIYEGTGEWTDPQTDQKYLPRTKQPGLPHGPLSLIAVKIAFVHTHPDETDSSVRPKNRFGKGDISAYLYGTENVMVMLNADGIHLLVGRDQHVRLDPQEIAQKAHENVNEAGDTDQQIRAKVARALSQFGIAYYYSQTTTTAPDGFLTLSRPN